MSNVHRLDRNWVADLSDLRSCIGNYMSSFELFIRIMAASCALFICGYIILDTGIKLGAIR